MGITKQLLKAEIDKLDDQYLEEIYKLVKSLEASRSASSDEGWHRFC